MRPRGALAQPVVALWMAADDMTYRLRGVWPRVRLGGLSLLSSRSRCCAREPRGSAETPVRAALRSCGSGRLLPRLARPVPTARAGLRPDHGRLAGMEAPHRYIRLLAVAADGELRRRKPTRRSTGQERSSLAARTVGAADDPERHSVQPLSAGDMPRLSLPWTESLGLRIEIHDHRDVQK